MGKCYTLSFDSNYFTGGIDNSSRTYNVDWSFLPLNKRVKVTFSYMSCSAGTIIGAVNVMALHLNLGQTSNFYCTGTNGLQSSQYVGTLRMAVSSAPSSHGYYFADVTSNPPIYLEQRPAQNVLAVQLNDGVTTTGFATPVPTEYLLTLAFEEVDYD